MCVYVNKKYATGSKKIIEWEKCMSLKTWRIFIGKRDSKRV